MQRKSLYLLLSILLVTFLSCENEEVLVPNQIIYNVSEMSLCGATYNFSLKTPQKDVVWRFNDGSSISGASVKKNISSDGQITVTAKIGTQLISSVIQIKLSDPIPLNINYTSNTLIAPTILDFRSSSFAKGNNSWFLNNVKIDEPKTITFNKSGFYSVYAQDNSCNQTKDTENIIILDNPISNYVGLSYKGFRIYCDKSLMEDPYFQKAYLFLKSDIDEMESSLKKDVFEKMSRTPTVIESNPEKPDGAAFHPSYTFAKNKGSLFKESTVEYYSAKYIVNMKEWANATPSIFLHEMAHSYHFLYMDKAFDNYYINEVYKSAIRKGLYSGTYSATNRMEYFATLAEKYFGRSNFFPKTKEELKAYDPDGYEMIKTVLAK
ncbi:MAG TPA: hypothetical protein VK175_15625 [Leadbetterella sp.]|nr:hypothetical protein [Leadbetterella sp.]